MADENDDSETGSGEIYTLRKGMTHSVILNGARINLTGGGTTRLTPNQAKSFGDKFIKGDHSDREQDDAGGPDTTPPGGTPENIDQTKVAVRQAGDNQPPQAPSSADPKVPSGQTATPAATAPAPATTPAPVAPVAPTPTPSSGGKGSDA